MLFHLIFFLVFFLSLIERSHPHPHTATELGSFHPLVQSSVPVTARIGQDLSGQSRTRFQTPVSVAGSKSCHLLAPPCAVAGTWNSLELWWVPNSITVTPNAVSALFWTEMFHELLAWMSYSCYCSFFIGIYIACPFHLFSFITKIVTELKRFYSTHLTVLRIIH